MKLLLKKITLALFASFLICAILVNLWHQLGFSLPIVAQELIFVLSFVLSFLRAPKLLDLEFNWRVPFLTWLLFVPLYIFILWNERFQISHHGFLHHHYVLQLLNGSIPENVSFPGNPAPIYWAYHSILAVFSHVLQLASPTVNTLLNAFCLFMSFVFLNYIILEFRLKLSVRSGVILLLIALFSLNTIGWFYFIQNLVDYGKGVFQYIPVGVERLMLPEKNVAQMSSLLSKYFNYSGTPLGYSTMLLSFYLTLKFIKSRVFFIDLMVVLSAGILLHITIGAFSGLMLFMTAVIIISIQRNWSSILHYLQFHSWYILVALILLGLNILYIREGSSSFDAGRVLLESNPRMLNSMLITLSVSVIGAVLLLGKNMIKKYNFLIVFVLVGYGLTMIIQIPITNQYKASHIASIAHGILLVLLVKEALIQEVLWRRIVAVFIGVSILMNIFIYQARTFSSEWKKDDLLYFSNTHINQDSDHSITYYWIRENTPRNAILLTPVQDVYHNPYQAIGERLCYVSRDWVFSTGDAYWQRRLYNKQFYEKAIPAKDLLSFIKKDIGDRPLYVVIPENFHPFSMPKYANKLYENRFVSIYKIPNDAN